MAELLMMRMQGGLYPAVEEAVEYLKKLPLGKIVKVKVSIPRNVRFFRKWWALVKYAYEHWEPAPIPGGKWRGVVPQKAFDRFRKDLTILAGYYEAHYRIDGSVRVAALSIAWGSMGEDAFEHLYSNTIDVILKHIMTDTTREDLDGVIENILRFD